MPLAAPLPAEVTVWMAEVPSAMPLRSSAELPTLIVLLPPVAVTVSVPPPVMVRPLAPPVPVADRVRLSNVNEPAVFVPPIASSVLAKPLLFAVRFRWLTTRVPVMLLITDLTPVGLPTLPPRVVPLKVIVPVEYVPAAELMSSSVPPLASGAIVPL